MGRVSKLSRKRLRGVTLVEVMIVVVILGLIAGGAAVALFPKLKEGQIKTTRTNMFELRRAALQWRADHGDDCPTPQTLIRDRALDSASKITDAWDTPFHIVCEGDETFLESAGPDRKFGTADDIRIPELAAEEEP